MAKSKGDIMIKRSSLMMILNSDVEKLNINMLFKMISVSKENVYKCTYVNVYMLVYVRV